MSVLYGFNFLSFHKDLTGKGCASVLKTHLSKGSNLLSSLNKRYKYFNVSAKKKLSSLSL